MADLVPIGLLVAERSYRHGTKLTEGVLDYAKAVRGWGVVYLMNHKHLHGTLAGAVVHTYGEYSQYVAGCAMPCVNVSNRDLEPMLPRVVNDEVEIGRIAGRYAVERGYRQVIYDGIQDFAYSQQRLAGLREVLEQADGRVVVLPEMPIEQEDTVRWFSNVLKKTLPEMPGPLMAVGCNDERATRLVQVCQPLGYRVPDDIAVLGIDNDILQCRMAEPELSSVETDAYRIGYEAARMLDTLMQDPDAEPEPVRIAPIGVSERRSTDAYAIDDGMVVDGIRWFREHAAEGVNVTDAVRALGVPRRSFETRFKKALGRTPLDELRRARIQRCKDLLARTDFAMPQVAARSGFRDAKVMGMTFRKEAGMTPTAYRNRHRSR